MDAKGEVALVRTHMSRHSASTRSEGQSELSCTVKSRNMFKSELRIGVCLMPTIKYKRFQMWTLKKTENCCRCN